MPKRIGLVFTAMVMAGCAGITSTSLYGSRTLVLTPQVIDGAYRTQTTVSPYTSDSINHLVLELKTGATLVASKTLPQSSLAQTVVFSNLRANTAYTVQAYAYLTGDSSAKISEDAQSLIAFTVNTDNSPAVNHIPVKLIDIPFNGQASSSGVVVNPGSYIPIASESLSVPYLITTLAGNAGAGFADGVGTLATFNSPSALAQDAAGNLYVADTMNSRIRKVTLGGGVTTVAGSVAGVQDGNGTSAKFYCPQGLTVDTSGNIFVADTWNHRIRKITPSGVVTTVAGNSSTGFANGMGTAATFNEPSDIGIDAAGNLYVDDYINCSIRKIAPSGMVTTLVGNGIAGATDGTGTAASINLSYGLAVAADGTVYVADTCNCKIRKITPGGVASTVAGNGINASIDGTGTSASFKIPVHIAVDLQGNLYVSDREGQKIRKITTNGVVTTISGNGVAGFADGTGTSATFNQPHGLVVDAFGNIHVTDASNNRIRRIQ